MVPLWEGLSVLRREEGHRSPQVSGLLALRRRPADAMLTGMTISALPAARSEEHTSELQSQSNLVCRLLLEKKHASAEVSRFLPPLSAPSRTALRLRARLPGSIAESPRSSQPASTVATRPKASFYATSADR